MRKRGPKIRRVTLHKDEIDNDADGGTPDEPHWRPKTRGDCIDLPRPCPYIGCKYHLYLDFTPFGSMKFNFGESIEALDVMPYTCALDVAEDNGHDMTKIASYLNVTPARVQQEVTQAVLKLRNSSIRLHGHADDDGEE